MLCFWFLVFGFWRKVVEIVNRCLRLLVHIRDGNVYSATSRECWPSFGEGLIWLFLGYGDGLLMFFFLAMGVVVLCMTWKESYHCIL